MSDWIVPADRHEYEAAVEAALGRPAATLARFAADHAHAFQRAV